MNSFILNSIMLGLGLAMDAFSVSLANGLNASCINRGKVFQISLTFGTFQTIMPLIGWIFVHSLINYFVIFQRFIPFIALILLLYIGGKMLKDGFSKNCTEGECCNILSLTAIIVQGIATSIDALSVGFTIAEYNLNKAITSSAIIGIVTFIICTFGVIIGKKFGTKLSNKSQIFGGLILIFIGIKIFISGI